MSFDDDDDGVSACSEDSRDSSLAWRAADDAPPHVTRDEAALIARSTKMRVALRRDALVSAATLSEADTRRTSIARSPRLRGNDDAAAATSDDATSEARTRHMTIVKARLIEQHVETSRSIFTAIDDHAHLESLREAERARTEQQRMHDDLVARLSALEGRRVDVATPRRAAAAEAVDPYSLVRPLSSHHDLLGYALHTSLDIVLERALARVDDGDTPSLVDALRDVARYVFVALTHEPEPTVRAEAARLGAAYRALRFETVDHFKDAYCAWLLRIHFLRNVSFELWIKRYYAIQIWLPYQRDCARDAATHRGVADATVTAAAAALYATPYMHRVSFSTTLDDDESSLFFVLYTRERVFERHDDWRIEKDARFSNCFYCTIYAENE